MVIVVLAASNPAVAALRAEALRRAGIDFVPAADLDALQRALLTIRPDAVLLDLPLTGLERQQPLDLPGSELLICGPPEAGAAVTPPHRFLTASTPRRGGSQWSMSCSPRRCRSLLTRRRA